MAPSSSEPVVVDSLSGDEVDFECPNAALLDEQVFLDRNPLISRSAIAITLANLACISFTIVWLIRNGFSVDLFTLALIILCACTLTINCVIGAQIVARVQEASIVTGKPEDFQDYVVRMASGSESLSEKKFVYWLRKFSLHSDGKHFLASRDRTHRGTRESGARVPSGNIICSRSRLGQTRLRLSTRSTNMVVITHQ